MWEQSLLAKQAPRSLKDRSAFIAGKPCSHREDKFPRHRVPFQACFCNPTTVRGMPTNPGKASIRASQARTLA